MLVAYLWYVANTKSFSDLQTTLYTLYLMLFKVENVSVVFTHFPGPGILAEEIPYFLIYGFSISRCNAVEDQKNKTIKMKNSLKSESNLCYYLKGFSGDRPNCDKAGVLSCQNCFARSYNL